MLLTDPTQLSDDALIESIAALNRDEREATAALIAHLAELESRELHLALGFTSLYAYCRGVLNLAEHEAYNRMQVAGVARRFPVVVTMLAEGRVHLTAVRLLGPHLVDENHLALLGGAIHKSKDEVKEQIARWFPRPAPATSIRAVAARRAADGDVVVRPGAEGATEQREERPNRVPDLRPETRPATVEPVSAERFVVRLSARRRTVERLRRAQELLSHAVPDGDVDEILYRALGELLGRLEVQREGDAPANGRRRGERARTARPTSPDSRHVPAEVERAVRRRDEERCAFVGIDGRRCEERRFLQLHHLRPWAAGGPATIENIALRCRAHNRYEARLYFDPIAGARAGEERPTSSATAGARGASSFRNESGGAPP